MRRAIETMWLLGTFILAILALALAGGGAFAAVSLLPDWDDAAGRGLGEALRAVLIAGYVILSLALYGLALARRDRGRHLRRALYILLLVPFLIVVLGMIQNGVGNVDWLKEATGMVQMFAPLWIVAWIQWAVLHAYVARQTPRSEAASA
jgi:hypothetical protein